MSPAPAPAPAGRGALGDLGLELLDAVCIIADRFYWVGVPSESQRDTLPTSSEKVHFFSTDDELVYHPFHSDFGPVNLSRIVSYAKIVQAKLKDPSLDGRLIVHYCSSDSKKQTNAAWLACAFQVMALGRSPDDAYERFDGIISQLLPFRDALNGPCTYECTILDCLRGLQQAIQLGWFNLRRFNRESYDYFTQVENGDMNWIVPFKFLAFSSPSATSVDEDGCPALTPEDYVPVFHDGGIRLVVRLSKKQYDRKLFVNGGIKHVDLYFSDGSCPSPDIVSKFLLITENQPGAMAVHCTAGLGRTGTLIGLYAMKHYRFPARAFIGWCRTCRPGSILGRQQQFLVDMEKDMFQAGEAARRPRPPPSSGADEALALQIQLMTLHSCDRGGYGDYEDAGQGDRLTSAKRRFQALGLQGVAATA